MTGDLTLTTADVAAMFGVSQRTAQGWGSRITSEVTGSGTHRARWWSASHAACLRAASEPGSLVPVAYVGAGDILALDSGPVLVTGTGPSCYWDGTGRHEGTAVHWVRGSARGVFTRSAADTIVRLRHASRIGAAAA